MSALINSQQQMLNEDEIFGIVAQETHSEYSPEQIKAALLAETYEGGALIVREGNTLFVVNPTENANVVVFRALNADTLPNYIDNSVKFIEAMGSKNVEVLVTTFNDPRIMEIIKLVKNKIAPNNGGVQLRQLNENKYMAIINIKNIQQLTNNGLNAIQGAQ